MMKSESEQWTVNIITKSKSESEHHHECVGMKATLHGWESESEYHDEKWKWTMNSEHYD